MRASISGALFYDALDKLLLFLLLASIALFILYPILCSIYGSFFPDGVFSAELYKGLIKANRKIIANSFTVAICTSLLTTLFSTAVALRLCAGRGLVKKLFTVVLLISLVSPPFVSSLAYVQLFGRRGWISYHLLGLSVNPYGAHGIVLMQSLSFIPLNALFLQGILEKMDASLLHASRDLGASPSATLVHTVLPLMRPALLACLLLSLIRSLADFGTPIVIGGRFEVLASQIYLRLIGYADLPSASALNTLILVPVSLFFLAYRILMERSDRLLPARAGKTQELIPLGGIGRIAVELCAWLFFLMTSLQYACVFASGFLKSIKGKYSFTLEHLRRLLAYDISSLWRSTLYALIVGVAGTLFAMLFAYYIERRRIPLRGSFDFIATMPYMLPGICFGLGYILAFNHAPLKLTGTVAIVLLNMLFKQLPNGTKICSASLAQLPSQVENAARDLGASRFHTLKDIVLPCMKRAFLTGFIYNFTASMTTAGAILFLINPGKKVAVFRLFDAINTGEYGLASLLAACITLITLLVNLVLGALMNAETKEKRYVYHA